MSARIKHIECSFPEEIYTNKNYFLDFPETKNNKSLKKLGIENRHIVSSNVTASDLAVKAAEKLFNNAKISPNDIDFILFCAQEFDYYTPTTACVIQHRLNIPSTAGALDFNLGCSGFVYGLSIAKGLIASNQVKNVLLLNASTLTKTFYKKDKSSRFLFGDAATATLITKDETKKIGEFIFGTDGSRFDKIIVKDGGARNKINENSFKEHTDTFGNCYTDANFFMDGSAIFMFSIKTVPNLIKETVAKNNLTFNDIDYFVLHQPNEFILRAIQKKLHIPDDKFVVCLRNFGNTVSCTIPIAIKNCILTKNLDKRKNLKILIAAFGVGLSWSATIIEI